MPVADITLPHHERSDGCGYPSAPNRGDMHPEARIPAVADGIVE